MRARAKLRRTSQVCLAWPCAHGAPRNGVWQLSAEKPSRGASLSGFQKGESFAVCHRLGSPALFLATRRVPHPTVFRVRILIFSWLDFWSSIPRGCFLALLRLFPRSFVVAGLHPGSFSRHSSLATSHFL